MAENFKNKETGELVSVVEAVSGGQLDNQAYNRGDYLLTGSDNVTTAMAREPFQEQFEVTAEQVVQKINLAAEVAAMLEGHEGGVIIMAPEPVADEAPKSKGKK